MSLLYSTVYGFAVCFAFSRSLYKRTYGTLYSVLHILSLTAFGAIVFVDVPDGGAFAFIFVSFLFLVVYRFVLGLSVEFSALLNRARGGFLFLLVDSLLRAVGAAHAQQAVRQPAVRGNPGSRHAGRSVFSIARGDLALGL